MSKVALLSDSEIGLINPNENKMPLKNNPISKYNYVILNYNSDYCLVDDIKLKLMKESFIYSKLFPFLKNPAGTILFLLILLVVPIVNIFLYLFLMMSLYSYFTALDVFRTNLQKNPDPFRNMIFSAEICESIKNINWGFDIVVSGFFKQ
jgi:hypothetical protein